MNAGQAIQGQQGSRPFAGQRRAVWVRIALAILVAWLWALPVMGQGKPGAPSRPEPRQVFRELLWPYRNLNDYTVKLQAKVEMPSLRIPHFTATLYFKKPDRFHIETRSFAPLPRDSGVFNPFQFDPEKNRITYLRSESLSGVATDLYRVDPGEKEKRLRYSQVWIGGTPARIMQVETLSVRGTRGLVTFSYQSVDQGGVKWLLPEKVRVQMTFPEGDKNGETTGLFIRDNPVSSGIGRLDELKGEGRIDLAYSDWRLNTGLEDRLFEQRPDLP